MYAQLLIAVSLSVAAYQDVRQRTVNDLVWIPAIAGVALAVYTLYSQALIPDLEFLGLKIALVGGVVLVATFIGVIGQADAICWAFLAADPYQLSPVIPLIASAPVLAGHVLYEYRAGNMKRGLTIPVARFLKEQQWIPKALIVDGVRTEVDSDVNVARDEVEKGNRTEGMVEVSYGVPTVAYLGIGYIAYLGYLVVFNTGAFLGLP